MQRDISCQQSSKLQEGVELRIVSEQKPFPDAAGEEAALEDLYLYFTCLGAEAASVRRKA